MTAVDLRATPDSFVVLVAAPWGAEATALVVQTFEETWVEPLQVSWDDEAGHGVFGVGDQKIAWVIEEPIPELVELAGSSFEPYAPTEVVLLERHTHIWRLVVGNGVEGAVALLKLMNGFVEAGASGAFLPQTMRLHSPRTIRVLSMDPTAEQALANVYVNAWHGEEWMRTRGLTAFGYPELETPIVDGMNAAYFRLMDVAANMIRRGGRFPNGSQIEAGPRTFMLRKGPTGPDDQQVPFSGHFGVQSLIP